MTGAVTAVHLSSLTLSQFRSHPTARLTLDGRPLAIWGPNGAGKTSILEAISLLSPGRGLRRAAAEDMARRPSETSWKVHATLATPQAPREVETSSENGAARTVRIDGKSTPQTALGELLRVLWLIPAMDRLWIEGADGRRRFLDRITLSFTPSHAEAALTYEKAMRERNRLLKDQVRDGFWYTALEMQMADAGALLHNNRLRALERILAAQDGAETAFPIADLALVQSEGEMPATTEEFRTALNEGRQRDLAAGRTLIGPHRSDMLGRYAAKGLPASDCSTGEQKALLLSLLLANARALQADTGTPPILLLDEVAAHLDATRRAALYDEICALGAQAFMTGTGPELFSELGARAQGCEVTENAGLSQATQGPLKPV